MKPVVLAALASAATVLAACSATPSAPADAGPRRPAAAVSELEVQALVMGMADDYAAGLSEAVYLALRGGSTTPRQRWLAQSFLRNGFGAALDIAAGPNPDVALLDLLVLASLQTWAFDAHWFPAGDPADTTRDAAAARLRDAEATLWLAASRVMSERQRADLRALIDAWIAAHPDRVVVSLVRFEDFTDERMRSTLGQPARARGLLREVSEASATVDQARLLGERVLWYSSRLPYLLGQQTELTAYRMLDQPELDEVVGLVSALREHLATLDDDLLAQQDAAFERLARERSAAVADAERAVDRLAADAIERLEAAVTRQRDRAIAETFDRVARERSDFLDDLAAREGELNELLTGLRDTIEASGALASELTGTVDAIDRVVGRFDADPNSPREPLQISEVRDAAIETAHAAERLTTLLERTESLLMTPAWDDRIDRLNTATAGLVDRAFARGMVLVVVLLAGLGILRLVPQRRARQA